MHAPVADMEARSHVRPGRWTQITRFWLETMVLGSGLSPGLCRMNASQKHARAARLLRNHRSASRHHEILITVVEVAPSKLRFDLPLLETRFTHLDKSTAFTAPQGETAARAARAVYHLDLYIGYQVAGR